MLRNIAGLLCITLLVFAPLARGQGERATLTGAVTDTTKAAVPDAQIILRNTATNVIMRTATNAEGLYYITSIPPGTYQLTVQKSGFRPARVDNIPLTTGLAATQDVTLEVGAVQEAVEVSATAVQIEAQSSDMNTVVTTRPVSELPILGRDPLSFAALAPGVIPTQGQQSNAGIIGRVTTAQIGGGLAQQNGVLIDGAESRGTTESGNAYSVPVEAVQEFKLETASFNAQYGRVAGGVAILATKSGTNTLHGTVYEYLRNNHLNANSWQNDRNGIPIALFQRNVFGANLGGPVYIPKVYNGRDKTFFFFNYEGSRQASPDQVLDTVPTGAQRAGDFSQTYDRNGNLDVIYDPLTTRPDPNNPGKYIRDPFPGNRIPSERINHISANVVKYYPLPNRQGLTPQQVNNFLGTGKAITKTDNYLARVDHNFSDQHRLFGRFGYAPYTNFSSLSGVAFAERSVNSNPGTSALIAFTSNFTPNVLGEFRLSYTRLQFNSFPTSQNFDLASLGFGPNFTQYVKYAQFPNISVQTYAAGTGLTVTQASPNDFAQLGQATRTLNPQDNWQAQYQFTFIKTRHTIRAGTDLQLIKLNAYNSQYSAGQFNFDRTYTQGPDPTSTTLNGGNGLASLLLGIPVAGTITITNPLFLYQKYYSLFVQDDYRVTNRLTANLGLRWEYQTPYAEKFGQIGYFDFNGIEPATGQKGVFRLIKPGGYQENPQYWNFSPRVGLAWQAADKTVIRAGAGIFFSTFVGVNAAATDFGNGGFVSNFLFLGPPNPLPNTPPVGGSWDNPFAGGIQQPSRDTDFVGQAVRADNPNRPKPYLSDWTFSIQREVTPTMLAEVAYVGSKMTHLFWNRQNNEDNPLLLSLGPQLNQPVANPFFGKITTGALSTPTVQLKQLLRPYPQYQDVLIFRDAYGDMRYNSFTARVTKQYSHGILFQLAYTLSKTIANTAQSNTWVVGPSNALYNPNYNRSLEANDVPQRLVLSYIYDFPAGPGKRYFSHGVGAAVLGGWEFSGISVFQSGRPILITAPDQTNLFNFSYTNGRANRLHSPVLESGRTNSHWFDTAAFAVAPPFTVPNDSLSQPNLRGPRRINTDISLIKNTRIKERANIQFRAEFYNIFNHPALGAPVTDVTNAQFGQIITSIGGSERNVQFGLRALF
ncbi:MAG TPA: TonB-dependent receptor [Bryobacteraceae bacterium]|nr:TonB-dependent receptor [Bryobacteraceae bacterium]